MTIITNISTEFDEDWNERFISDQNATVHQTSDFGEFQCKRQNQPTYYITFKEDNEIVGQLVLLKISRIEWKFQNQMRKYSILSKLIKSMKNLKPMYIWYYGPAIFDTTKKMKFLKKYQS